MRNFYITSKFSGKQTLLKGGTVGKDGNFTTTVHVKEGGMAVRALTIVGQCTHTSLGDRLILEVMWEPCMKVQRLSDLTSYVAVKR